MSTSAPVGATGLPRTILSYLTAHTDRDVELALSSFAPDAVVVDDGRTYRGLDEVRGFLRYGAAEFRYTSELVGAQRVDETHWVLVNHLEGDFPGGVVDLTYRFTIDGDRIAELSIAG